VLRRQECRRYQSGLCCGVETGTTRSGCATPAGVPALRGVPALPGSSCRGGGVGGRASTGTISFVGLRGMVGSPGEEATRRT
jgi:hypothetical protein